MYQLASKHQLRQVTGGEWTVFTENIGLVLYLTQGLEPLKEQLIVAWDPVSGQAWILTAYYQPLDDSFSGYNVLSSNAPMTLVKALERITS